MTLPRLCLAAALAFAALPLAHAQMAGMAPGRNPTFKPGPGPDELWEITAKMEMAGMPGGGMPAQTMQSCVKKGSKDADLVPKDDNCTMTDVKTSGNRTQFAMTCKGDPPTTGTGDITSTPTGYSGRITVRSTRRGQEMTMTQTFSGKKIGTCTDTSEQFVAKVQADAAASEVKICNEQAEYLRVMMFDPGQPCAKFRKTLCDKSAAVANTMRDPAGHRAARQKFQMGLKPAFDACGQDYKAVTEEACKKGAASSDWSFVGGTPCDPEVMANGPKYCNTGPNRSPDPQYLTLCSRYVALTRGTARPGAEIAGGAPSPADSAQAPPPKPDPIKSGVDAVRKLLPF